MPTTFSLAKVWKRYGEGAAASQALRDIELTIETDELLVPLLGPSGADRSTLLSILGGLDRATSSLVHFRGASLSGVSDHQLTLRATC